MTNIRWVIPQALEPVSDALPQGSQALTLAGNRQLRIGLLDNTKEQGDLILETVATALRERYGVAKVVIRRKEHYSKPATDALIAEMAKEVQVAVAAVGG